MLSKSPPLFLFLGGALRGATSPPLPLTFGLLGPMVLSWNQTLLPAKTSSGVHAFAKYLGSF